MAEAEDVLLKSKGLIESNLKVHTSHSAESPAFMEPEDSFSEIALVVVIPETDKALTRINQLREKE